MKRIGLPALIILFFIMAFMPVGASNNKLQWHSFNEGLAKAKKDKKMVLIDFYTDWCGYCKKMDAETYSNDKIIQYLNSKYVLVKINPEKSGDLKYKGTDYSLSSFTRSLGINGYPSTLFMEYDEELVTLVPGYIQTGEFLNIIEFLGERHYKTMKYEEFLKTKKS